MSYFLAPALVQLRTEVDRAFRARDRSSDGWIGDPSHAARASDHNPCWSCSGRATGIVRALDVDISPDGRPDLDLRTQILKAAIGDPRVFYVISNSRIYSRSYGWAARVYTGTNPHTAHVHVSLNGVNGVNPDGNFDTASWGLTDGTYRDKDGRLLPVSLLRLQHAARHPRRQVSPLPVTRVQGALNVRVAAGLTLDGVYGPRTREAYAQWVRRLGYTEVENRGLPRQHSLTRLGRRRFRVVR